ncbi:hypothetical protein [Anatilimnocola floriformis]|uniref:hypothetical protein n=1 Tax=Anatilimnocola floriformis TaxID=2948575 RepID=UPI0020C3C211|nr:hypothetical protein [Anatilimnocola floriformis]
MNLPTTLLFYLLIGVAVAVAVHLAWQETDRRNRWFCTCTAIPFWPLYLPVLLQRTSKPNAENREAAAAAPPIRDELSTAIQQVQAELELALRSLDGWSDAALAREQGRFVELRKAWNAQADKIRELDQLLQQPSFAVTENEELLTQPDLPAANSDRGRRANIARLAAVRRRLHDDLTNTLAWVRELVTMIHLAKYTGAPASRAEELVMQIATSVEGLSEVASWRGEEATATDTRGL